MDCNATQRKHCMELGSQCNYHCCHRIPMEWQGVLNLFTPSPWFLKFHITPSLLRVFYYRFAAPVHGLFSNQKRQFSKLLSAQTILHFDHKSIQSTNNKGSNKGLQSNFDWNKAKPQLIAMDCFWDQQWTPRMLYQFPPNLHFSIFWNLLTLQS